MKNTLTNSVNQLVNQIKLAIVGVTKYAATLKLVAHPVADLTSEKAALETADNNHKQAKDVLKTKYTNQRSVFKSSRTFATLVREVLKPHLGSGYSELWGIVGFAGNSIGIPRSIAGMLALLAGIEHYLTQNPQFANTEANLTAERAKALHDQLLAAKSAVDEARSNRRTASTTRTQKGSVVKRRLRGLLDDLEWELPSTDGKFLEFGFNIPGLPMTPEVPLNLLAVLVGPLAAALKWDRAARAERYRIYRKVAGVDDEFVLVESREDLDYVIEGLPANKTIEIAVSAINAGGESAKSEVVTVTTP